MHSREMHIAPEPAPATLPGLVETEPLSRAILCPAMEPPGELGSLRHTIGGQWAPQQPALGWKGTSRSEPRGSCLGAVALRLASEGTRQLGTHPVVSMVCSR